MIVGVVVRSRPIGVPAALVIAPNRSALGALSAARKERNGPSTACWTDGGPAWRAGARNAFSSAFGPGRYAEDTFPPAPSRRARRLPRAGGGRRR